MKQILKFTPIVMLLLILSFSSCEKEAMSATKKSYSERKAIPPGGWGDAMRLELNPNGTARLIENGDEASHGNYSIVGKKLIFKAGSLKYMFTIISEKELLAETGERLILNE